MKLRCLILFWLALIPATFSCVFVKLSDGIIKGRIVKTLQSEKTFYAFQEIPYATPPLGGLRFQAPQPVTKWEGILDTTKNRKICYQMTANSPQETEDCLYLNVYTPELASTEKQILLPVMVYIHGGGFVIGDGTHRNNGPEFLINHDVIIVTLNYRLGVFGFLSTQDKVIPGNNGLKDQLFALQWVNKNIHNFGGDNSKITIFGQSAGAASVGYHLINKKSEGLYRAAIMESASALSPFGYQRNAKYYALKIATNLSSTLNEDSTSEEILDVMLKASAEDIDVASQTVASQESYDNAQLFQGYYYAPVIEPESEEAFLTEKMFELIKRGDAVRVPIIIGINSEESVSQSTDLQFLQRLMSAYDNDLKALVPNDMNIESESVKMEVGERIRKLYSGNNLMQESSASGIKYMSDVAFTKSVIKYALLQSSYSDLYFYQFSYDGKMGNVSVTVNGADRVGHNEELAYLWRVANDLFVNYDLSIYPIEDIVTQNRLLTLWTNFAKTLNPTPEKTDLLQNLTWPTVKADNDFPYLNIDEKLEIKNFPKKDSFEGWTAIYEDFGVEPYDTY